MAGIDLSLGGWLAVVILGALVGLDGASWPQLMISRPIAAGTLGGLLFGDPAAGFLSGAILEIVNARHPPYGAARYPETGPASLVAGAAYAGAGSAGLLPLITVTLAGWAIGWIGSYSVQIQRAVNGRLVGDPNAFGGDARALTRRHRLAMRLDGARAAVITGAFVVPTMVAARLASTFPLLPTQARISGALAAAGIAGLAGVGARVLGGRRRGWPAFAVGALVGAALGVAVA